MKNNTVLILLAIAAGLWYVSKQPGAALGAKTPQGTLPHQLPGGAYVPGDPNYVLMEHPTQGRAWIPNEVVAQYLPPYGEWKVV